MGLHNRITHQDIMKTMTKYAIAVLSVVAFLGLALAACDGTDSQPSEAGTNNAAVQEKPVADRPIARYDEGKLMLLVSTDEAREAVMEAARKLVDDVGEVRFEDPMLKMVGDWPYLMMRGERPDGNCALAYVRLASEETLAAGTTQSINEARISEEQNVDLYKAIGGSCSGDPCNSCRLISASNGEACLCAGHGPGGEPGWCNHSTG